ncbi:SHOCT-like domain-containing protein [Microtetraspora malaysiensis]|uniref:SHOCT-like domain-containing protein n=1 Tax=Microtetraspora malaysiensis TaxID=161358 RepID=UPI003D8E435E
MNEQLNEQRKDILDMLAEGKITAEEAEQLIAALERDRPPVAASLDARPKGKAKYLRVVVDGFDEDGGSARVNIRVPLQLLRAGVQLAALIPPQALTRANAELHKSGMPFDLTQLKPEQLEAFVDHLDELTVEVDGPDGQVRIFCE